jgi:hypothetical protein
MGFGTYDHIASQTSPYSNSLDRYYYMKTWRMVDSYPNFILTAEHKLLAYPQESYLLSQFAHQSKGDKQN